METESKIGQARAETEKQKAEMFHASAAADMQLIHEDQ